MIRLGATAACFATFFFLAPTAHLAQRQSSELADPPAEPDLRERGMKLIANQHKNDDMIDQYERTEHELLTTGGASARTLVDRTTQLMPNGAGMTKVLLAEGGKPVPADEYRKELQNWVNVLQFMVNPNDERYKTAVAKYQRRRQTRSDLVDSMLMAFTRKWIGREMRDGRDCDVVMLAPDTSFRPKSILEEALTHATAKIWVDHQANQLVFAEAQITSDFSVGGGVLGKLYKGGTFSMEQAEVEPGVWLPVKYRFDFSGRKFLFSFEEHQIIEASNFRYIGPPKAALAVAQSELSNPKPAAVDP